ncbi:hypothetical protein AVEN_216936-1 [Araneus ventricosus]|uniref:Uncharacterized protein n=1 Tax=Araneus ventricosus TaxID=182803 RepID=A0A4Y2UFU9_ARAVE|nr:hypothetical protein AVEN_246744-1 [Araneus ventricosus]GBO10677.1 hypothetical protein AVEN_18631-1 [Araneus ventricosus]GBO11934.1 hypothetical protein AVEN_24904-1 [Araneus ventricosus]GBO11945.1 hypothetical protein AVEN_216936-1 [Araneus ventricosus]
MTLYTRFSIDKIKGVDICVPESQSMGYNAAYYVKLLDELGFEVKYRKVEEKTDVFTSDEEYQNFYTSISVLRDYVSEDRREEFENVCMEHLFKKNARDSSGLPLHRGKMIELIIKKK